MTSYKKIMRGRRVGAYVPMPNGGMEYSSFHWLVCWHASSLFGHPSPLVHVCPARPLQPCHGVMDVRVSKAVSVHVKRYVLMIYSPWSSWPLLDPLHGSIIRCTCYYSCQKQTISTTFCKRLHWDVGSTFQIITVSIRCSVSLLGWRVQVIHSSIFWDGLDAIMIFR